jgi:DNA-binding NtrC family response regulator
MSKEVKPAPEAKYIGSDPKTLELLKEARRRAKTLDAVLLLGESGTGKDVLAHVIHEASNRQNKTIKTVNCAELSAGNGAVSALFGHVAGAYTGANHARKGAFRDADGGTLFLDEFGTLEMHVQNMLLRVVETGQVSPLGDDKVHKVDVRIIAATSADLHRETQERRFKKDLFLRFHVCEIPPLRSRTGDIPALANYFLQKHANTPGRNSNAKSISAEAMRRLGLESWEGNVRELEHTIKDALLLTAESEEAELDVEHFRFRRVPQGVIESGDAEIQAAQRAMQALARWILQLRIEGKLPRETINDMAGKYFNDLSLRSQLCAEFLAKYRGSEADRAASDLFGYADAESVRSLRRDTQKSLQEREQLQLGFNVLKSAGR